MLDRERDGPRARSDVEHMLHGRRWLAQRLEQPVDEMLGLRTRHEHAAIDLELEPERMEAALTFDIGDRFTGETATHVTAELGLGVLGDHVVVARIEVHLRTLQRIREQMLGIAPRT